MDPTYEKGPELGMRSIAIDINRREYSEFAMTALKEQNRRYMLVILFLGALLVAMSFLPTGLAFTTSQLSRFVGVLFIFLGLVRSWSLKGQFERLYERAGHLKVKHTYIANEEGLRSESHDRSYEFVPWSAVTSIEKGQTGVYVMISGLSGHIIPERGFPSMADYKRFVNYIEAQHKRVQSGQ